MAITNGMKRCPSCQKLKSSNDFYISNRSSDGLTSYCRVCTIAKEKGRWVSMRLLKSENARLLAENNLLKELVGINAPALKDEGAPVSGQGSAGAGEGRE